MKIIYRFLSTLTLVVVFVAALAVPAGPAFASTAITFFADYDLGTVTVNFNPQVSAGTVLVKDALNVQIASFSSPGESITLTALFLSSRYDTTISVTATGSSTPTTASYRVPAKAKFSVNPGVDYVNEVLTGVRAGADLCVMAEDDLSSSSYAVGNSDVWSGAFRVSSVLESDSIPELTADGFTKPKMVAHLRKVEDKMFMSDVAVVTIANRTPGPNISQLDIDFTKEQLKPKDPLTTKLQFSEDMEGPYENFTALELKNKKRSYIGKTIYLRLAAEQNTKLASKPIEYSVPDRAATPEQSDITTLFNYYTEEFYQNATDLTAGSITFEYRINKKDNWKPVPFSNGTRIDLKKLGSGLDKGIKKLEIRRAGTLDETVGYSVVPDSLTEHALLPSEPMTTSVSRPISPKRSEIKLVYENVDIPPPPIEVVRGNSVVGALVPAEPNTPPLEIATFKSKKIGEYLPVNGAISDVPEDGQTVYAMAPSTPSACDLVLGQKYVIRYAAVLASGKEAFASKPNTISLSKQRKADKYKYLPLYHSIRGVKDGKVLFTLQDVPKFNDIADVEIVKWHLYKSVDEDGTILDPLEPDEDDDMYAYFRKVGADNKTPAGDISLSVKIPKRAPQPDIRLGSSKPTSDASVVIDMYEEIVMARPNKIAYRLVTEKTSKPKWKIIKKAEIPLKSFIPKTDEVEYEFISAGDTKASSNAVKSNSVPFYVKFEARPDNPVQEDIVYDYAAKKYRSIEGKALLLSEEGKRDWTKIATAKDADLDNDIGVEWFNASKLKRGIYFKLAPVPNPNFGEGKSIGVPTSGKAIKFKFLPAPSAPAVTLTANGNGQTALIDDAETLEWALKSNSDKWSPAATKTLKDGDRIYVRTVATATSPASKAVKVAWNAENIE